MKIIIGSKKALNLAKCKFGAKTYVARTGKRFVIGTLHHIVGKYMLDVVYGEGRSWETALLSAGVSVPSENVGGLPVVQVSDNVARFSDADPLDTDAKEPIVECE